VGRDAFRKVAGVTRLAILILKSADDARFEDTLASVLANRPNDTEVLVVCPGGYDDPYELSGEVTFLDAMPTAEEPQLINTGIAHVPVGCEVVHLLASGLTVEEGWTEPALEVLSDPAIGAVAPLVLRPDGIVSAAGMRLAMTGAPRAVGAGRPVRRRLVKSRILGPALPAAFYRMQVVTELHGFDDSYRSWLSAADFALSMRAAGYRAAVATESHLFGNLDLGSGLSRFRECQLKERLFWKHKPSLVDWLLHPLPIAFEAIRHFPRKSVSGLLGRMVGLLNALFEARRDSNPQGRQGQERPREGYDDAASERADRTRRPAA
jgi:hypothetical protein